MKRLRKGYSESCQQTADHEKRNGEAQAVFDLFLIETKDLRENQTGASERRIAGSDRTYDHTQKYDGKDSHDPFCQMTQIGSGQFGNRSATVAAN